MEGGNILKTPGELLGEARERQGLSLEALSERTKIPVKVLAALEMDEYHKVSGPLYIKSFLRTCATDLGLDADHILDLYTRFGGESGPPSGEGDMVWEEDQVRVTRVGLPWPRILLACGLVVIAVGVALFALRGCRGEESEPADDVVVETAPARIPDDPRRGSLLTGDTTRTRSESATGEDEIAEATPDEDRPDAPPEETADPAPTEREAADVEEPAAQAPTQADGRGEDAEPESPGGERGGTRPAFEDTDPPPVPPPGRGGLPGAVAGNAGTPFADGQSWPVVLRLVTDLPVGAEVRRDGESAYQTAAWRDPVALPLRDIRPGRAYGVREGLVVYWGAHDHFSLRLDRVAGVEISINGVVRDISFLRPGQEIILDDHSAAGAGR